MTAVEASLEDEHDATQRRRGGDTAERILDVAERCFAQHGYSGTRLRDVAEGVGIRIPSLYNHFPNKQSLYAAVLERGMTPILDTLTRFTVAGGAASEPERVARALMELMARRPDLPRLIQYELLAGGDALAHVIDRWLRPTIASGLTALHASPAASSWKPDELPLLLLAFVHVVLGPFTTAPLYQALYGDDPLSGDAMARQSAFFARLVTILTTTSPSAPSAPEPPKAEDD